MNTTIAIPQNDVFKPTFESHVDPFFTKKYVAGRTGKYKCGEGAAELELRQAIKLSRPLPKSFSCWSEQY